MQTDRRKSEERHQLHALVDLTLQALAMRDDEENYGPHHGTLACLIHFTEPVTLQILLLHNNCPVTYSR
jgi:hypothetical protein